MGGISSELTASTKKELKKMAQSWSKSARDAGWDVDGPWSPEGVRQTPEGYKITLHAHT